MENINTNIQKHIQYFLKYYGKYCFNTRNPLHRKKAFFALQPYNINIYILYIILLYSYYVSRSVSRCKPCKPENVSRVSRCKPEILTRTCECLFFKNKVLISICKDVSRVSRKAPPLTFRRTFTYSTIILILFFKYIGICQLTKRKT